MKMKSDELRKAYLEYFRERGHTIVPSASLVPEGDPTLLFNIAGMVQFKQFYASTGPIPFTRAASVQKCLRATDLDEVGHTIKHHTFFEMMGNFSFGDYFKKEAIEWGWDFLTRVVGLPSERLLVTIYLDDDESYELWKNHIGIPADKIYRLGEEDNFWGPAGATGACGPCSEIHFDFGEGTGCGRPECSPACSCDRFVEVWNLVFPQFYKEADGSLSPLKRKGVDTGMGLERLAMVAQGVSSTFETDLLKPLVDYVSREAGMDPRDRSNEVSARVIADHARALCFAISEGVLPSNEGRGYVVRRILRRAVVKAMELGIQEAFLFKVAGRVIDIMRDSYPDLAEKQEKIALIIRSDEERFEKTLSRGMAILRDALDGLGRAGEKTLSGDVIFKLYDTYGFPVEITQELADAEGFTIDLKGFDRAMEDQRERARQASKIGKEAEATEEITAASETFVGYDTLEVPTLIRSLRRAGGDLVEAGEGDEVEVELERTPFYPEGGGQVGDVGTVAGTAGRGRVTDVKVLGGRIVHRVRVEKGALAEGDGVVAKVDVDRRKATQRNHTATHLMHGALRSILGGHVRQSGSLVSPGRLRFDFTHYEPMSEDEIRAVEDMVNAKVLQNISVKTAVETFEDAKAKGAIALFGEKYGQKVRVVEIEDASCELCGGTHVGATGEIGGFRIVSESGIAAGIRRIEAVTGMAVIDSIRDADRELSEVSSVLKVPARDLVDGARKLVERAKTLEKEISRLRKEVAGGEVERILSETVEVAGIPVAASRVEAPGVDLLKDLADSVKDRLGGGVVCVGSVAGDRVYIVISVDGSLVEDRGIAASAIAKKLGEFVGGKGGGKATFAQAGGKDTDKLDEAIANCPEVVARLAGKQT
jgi:alanyl-tRNA synthetase